MGRHEKAEAEVQRQAEAGRMDVVLEAGRLQEGSLMVRCGLCDIEISEPWDKHLKSKLHQSNLPKPRERVKLPVVPVREVSEAERKKNLNRSFRDVDRFAHAESLGYYSVANGRSYIRMRCECGEVSDVFAWRGCKKCPNCSKLLHRILSFR